MLDHKGFSRINGNYHHVYIFSSNKSFKILTLPLNPHSPIAQDWNCTKCILPNEITANLWWLNIWKINVFFPERNGIRVRLGWAIFEGICLFSFLVMLSLSPPLRVGRMPLYHLSSRKTMLFQRHVMCHKYLLDVLTQLWIPAAA